MNELPESFRDLRMTNISNLVTAQNRCFYVPLYQRDFSWKKEDRMRFLDDIRDGLSSFVKPGGSGSNESLTFLGSMISYRDNDDSIKLGGNGNWNIPSADLCAVIDGQQRLTMFMLLSAALHDYIRTRQGGGEEWLQLQAEEMLKSTSKIFQIESDLGGEHRCFPRMIRQDCDVWSRKQAKYWSPLSHYIHEYGVFSRLTANNGVGCLNKISPDNPSDPDGQKQRRNFVRLADEIIGEIAEVCNEWADIPDIREIVKNREAMRTLQIRELPDGCARTLQTEQQLELARAVVFAAYALRRVFFVATETTNEGLAFDIFESLNTTGQPLTAYETFKPDVIQFENAQKGYKNSPSAQHLGEIDGILRDVANNPRKDSLTSEMLVAFALSETGAKLSRKIRDQRNYLHEEYVASKLSVDDKRKFSLRMMETAIWLVTEKSENKWSLRGLIERIVGPGVVVPEEEIRGADFCLDFINGASHKISRGVFLRFYHAAMHADTVEEKLRKCIDLLRAIKATAAFFALLRGLGEPSSKVERCHRGIMEIDNPVFPRPDFSALPFCRKSGNEPNLRELKRAFRHYLVGKGGVANAAAWTENTLTVPLYDTDKNVAKFLVMVASNDTKRDEDNPGCIKPVNPGVFPEIIRGKSWGEQAHQTVEHIIPQSRADSLGRKAHCLGNLTLLPRRANSIISDRKWEERKAIYFALSAEDEKENTQARKRIAFLEADSVEFLLKETRYLPMTRTLAFCEEFTNSEVEKRHRNLSKLAWKTLAKDWLGFAE